MIKAIFKSAIFAGILWAMICGESNAQTNWYIDTLRNSVKVEFSKACFADLINIEYGGFGLFVSANYHIERKLWIVAEIPFAHTEYEYYDFYYNRYHKNSYDVLGNPYFGIRVWSRENQVYNEVGVRYPFSEDSDEGFIGGGFSNFEKSEAFQNDYITLKWTFNYIFYLDSNIYPRLYLGPLIYFPERFRHDRTTEIFISYGFDIYIDHDYLGICFGVNGIEYVSPDDPDIDTNETQLGFGPNFRTKKSNFGLRLNAPLGKDLNRFVDFAVNAYFQIKL